MTAVPARLHVIPAAACSKALILRRGPSDQVASILWDRSTDSFEVGQWLKGRIYEHRCDLSPDGKHIVYFAGDGQTWWTAVSRAPFLRALAFYPKTDTWGGGGAFDELGRLWFNFDTGTDKTLPDGLKPSAPDTFPTSTDGFHMGDGFSAVLMQKGWERQTGEGHDAVLTRRINKDWHLEVGFNVAAPNRSIISNRFALVNKMTQLRLDQPDWEWAEPFGDRLHFAASGALNVALVLPNGQLSEVTEIRQFNDMAFQALKAPYEGVVGR